jgi:hypothetical protein
MASSARIAAAPPAGRTSITIRADMAAAASRSNARHAASLMPPIDTIAA